MRRLLDKDELQRNTMEAIIGVIVFHHLNQRSS